MSLRFETRATQRRLGSKIEAKFHTFHPRVTIRVVMGEISASLFSCKTCRTQSLIGIYFDRVHSLVWEIRVCVANKHSSKTEDLQHMSGCLSLTGAQTLRAATILDQRSRSYVTCKLITSSVHHNTSD